LIPWQVDTSKKILDPDCRQVHLGYPLEGSGKDSISLLSDKSGWLLVDGQKVEVNRRELQTRMAGYSLQSLLKVHLELPELIAKTFGAGQPLYEGRERDEEGKLLHLIGLSRGENHPRVVRLAIEAETYLLRRVEYASADERVNSVHPPDQSGPACPSLFRTPTRR